VRFTALIGLRRIEIAAAAEPPLGGDDMAGVHVRGWAVRITQVRDQRNAGRPEARIVARAADLLGELGAELAVHGRHMNADFLEEPPAHHASDAAAKVLRTVTAPPWGFHEAPGLARVKARRRFVLQRLEGGADLVA